MGTRFRIYQKHRIDRTSQIVVLSDLTHAELMSVNEKKGEERTAALIHSHLWEAPQRPEGTTDEVWLATPLPDNWQPTKLVFSTSAEIGKELSTGQLTSLAAALVALSTPEAVLATFRNRGGEATGAESGSNGSTVERSTIGDTVRIS